MSQVFLWVMAVAHNGLRLYVSTSPSPYFTQRTRRNTCLTQSTSRYMLHFRSVKVRDDERPAKFIAGHRRICCMLYIYYPFTIPQYQHQQTIGRIQSNAGLLRSAEIGCYFGNQGQPEQPAHYTYEREYESAPLGKSITLRHHRSIVISTVSPKAPKQDMHCWGT